RVITRPVDVVATLHRVARHRRQPDRQVADVADPTAGDAATRLAQLGVDARLGHVVTVLTQQRQAYFDGALAFGRIELVPVAFAFSQQVGPAAFGGQVGPGVGLRPVPRHAVAFPQHFRQ